MKRDCDPLYVDDNLDMRLESGLLSVCFCVYVNACCRFLYVLLYHFSRCFLIDCVF